MKKTTSSPMYLVVVTGSALGSKGKSPLKQTMRVFPTLEQAKSYGMRAAKKTYETSMYCSESNPFKMKVDYVQISEVSGSAAPKLLRNPYNL